MAKPIVVEPSQGWDGDDGPWSTFAIRVGNPAQPLRVLASTAVQETWVVLQAGCTPQDGTKCSNGRGGLYNQNISTTWVDKGLFQLQAERNLNFTGYDNGDYGFDTLALGYDGSGGVSLDQQVVAGLDTKDFYLGFLGLNPQQINFSLTETHPSFLSNLKNRSIIPSLSFAYSAGAPYRLKKVDGTLTLGGYDASRFTPNNLSLTFASDVARDLVVGLQSIQFSDSTTANKELLSGGILAFVDSTTPHIWLPVSACQAFEKAFGLVYDTRTELYLVNDTLHNSLLAQNASLTFVLGNDIKGGETISITFPYLSFDLQASYSYLNATTQYFPLRRAANDTQYTLGRTFLQESYLIVDYERSNFSLSQSIFVENAEQKLIPILSINDTSHNITIVPQNPPKSNSKLSNGTLAGIVVAIAILCILVIGAIVFIVRRRRARNSEKPRSEDSGDPKDKPELDGLNKPVLAELYNPPGEADSREAFKPGLEMEGSEPVAKTRRLAEVEGSHGGVEMEGSRGGVEMDSGPAAVELDAGPVRFQKLAPPVTPTAELPSPGIPPEQQRLPSPGGIRKATPPGGKGPASAALSAAPEGMPASSGEESAEPVGKGRTRWSGPRAWGARRRRQER